MLPRVTRINRMLVIRCVYVVCVYPVMGLCACVLFYLHVSLFLTLTKLRSPSTVNVPELKKKPL